MVPSTISIVEKIQITNNGKVDRKRLGSRMRKAQQIAAADNAQTVEQVRMMN